MLMEAQDGRRKPRGDRAFDQAVDGVFFVAAQGQQHDLPGLHDGADAHGNGLARHLTLRLEKALVGLNGAVGEADDLGAVAKVVRRLVKADVAVASDAQQLEINAARLPDSAS